MFSPKTATIYRAQTATFYRGRDRGFRSCRALDAIADASEERIPNLVLYNYPSFSGALSALFAYLFHSRISLRCLILPFSSVVPFRSDDLCIKGLERCYLLDFLGPLGFAEKLSRQTNCRVIGFDHRKSVLSSIPSSENNHLEKIKFHVDLEKSSSRAAYDYFSEKLMNMKSPDGKIGNLLNQEDRARIEMLLNFVEDADLRRWSFPDIKAFNIGLAKWRSRINCITNKCMFDELLELNSLDLIAKGNSLISLRQTTASKFLNKAFKVRLGRGFYGECLGVRADGFSHLSDEIGKQLCKRSAIMGLRPIGAVVYFQRSNLKMCLRSIDRTIDTSEVSKAYGGGGGPCSSSFMIRMDEYNLWLSTATS